jgi:hypothetical protein
MKTASLWKAAFVLLFLDSCYNPQEGCLDTLSSNFAITADRNCTDCCEYPELSVELVHMMQDSSFDPLDTFVNQLGQRYSILDVRFYLSGFKLKQQGNPVNVIESLTPDNSSVKITDNIILWRSVDSKSKIGTVKAFGTFDALSFKLGIDSTLLHTSYENIPSGHPLSKEGKLKDSAGNPAWFHIKYTFYQPEPEIVSLYINRPFTEYLYTVDSLVHTLKGNPVLYQIKADYGNLLDKSDLRKSSEFVKNDILGNLSEMIIVK